MSNRAGRRGATAMTLSSLMMLTMMTMLMMLTIQSGVPVQAAPAAKPSRQACTVDPPKYACLRVDARRVPSGETATFTGTLSARAMRNLRQWTKGDNVVCLVRYKLTPEVDGWPGEVLEGACTTVRRDRSFTIAAELGRKGRYFYGVQMGPCRASAPGTGLCGSGDGGLLSVSPGARAVALRTT